MVLLAHYDARRQALFFARVLLDLHLLAPRQRCDQDVPNVLVALAQHLRDRATIEARFIEPPDGFAGTTEVRGEFDRGHLGELNFSHGSLKYARVDGQLDR